MEMIVGLNFDRMKMLKVNHAQTVEELNKVKAANLTLIQQVQQLTNQVKNLQNHQSNYPQFDKK